MLPEPTTTPSGSVAAGPSGASPDLPQEIAGGPEPTALVLINSVEGARSVEAGRTSPFTHGSRHARAPRTFHGVN